MSGNEVEIDICKESIFDVKNKTRSGNLRLVHAVKPETKFGFRFRKPETRKNTKNEINNSKSNT